MNVDDFSCLRANNRDANFIHGSCFDYSRLLKLLGFLLLVLDQILLVLSILLVQNSHDHDVFLIHNLKRVVFVVLTISEDSTLIGLSGGVNVMEA